MIKFITTFLVGTVLTTATLAQDTSGLTPAQRQALGLNQPQPTSTQPADQASTQTNAQLGREVVRSAGQTASAEAYAQGVAALDEMVNSGQMTQAEAMAINISMAVERDLMTQTEAVQRLDNLGFNGNQIVNDVMNRRNPVDSPLQNATDVAVTRGIITNNASQQVNDIGRQIGDGDYLGAGVTALCWIQNNCARQGAGFGSGGLSDPTQPAAGYPQQSGGGGPSAPQNTPEGMAGVGQQGTVVSELPTAGGNVTPQGLENETALATTAGGIGPFGGSGYNVGSVTGDDQVRRERAQLAQPLVQDSFNDAEGLARATAAGNLVGRDEFLQEYFQNEHGSEFFKQHMRDSEGFRAVLTDVMLSAQTTAAYNIALTEASRRFNAYQQTVTALQTPEDRQLVASGMRQCVQDRAEDPQNPTNIEIINCYSLAMAHDPDSSSEFVNLASTVRRNVALNSSSPVFNSTLHGYLQLEQTCGAYSADFNGFVNPENSGHEALRSCWWLDVLPNQTFCHSLHGADCRVDRAEPVVATTELLGIATESANAQIGSWINSTLILAEQLEALEDLQANGKPASVGGLFANGSSALQQLVYTASGILTEHANPAEVDNFAQTEAGRLRTGLGSGDLAFDAHLFRNFSGCGLDSLGPIHNSFKGYLQGVTGASLEAPEIAGITAQSRLDMIVNMAVACRFADDPLTPLAIYQSRSNIGAMREDLVQQVASEAVEDVLRFASHQVEQARTLHLGGGAVFVGAHIEGNTFTSNMAAPESVLTALQLTSNRLNSIVARQVADRQNSRSTNTLTNAVAEQRRRAIEAGRIR